MWVEDLNSYFPQKRDIDGQQVHAKYSISIIFREMQIKTTMRYHLTP